MNEENDLEPPGDPGARRSRLGRASAAIGVVAALGGSLVVGLSAAPADAATSTTVTTTGTCTTACTLPPGTISIVVTATGAAGNGGGSNGWASGGGGGLGTSLTVQYPVDSSSVVQPGATIAPVVLAGGSGGSGNEVGQGGGNGGNGILVHDTSPGYDLDIAVAAGGGGGGGAGGLAGTDGATGVNTNPAQDALVTCYNPAAAPNGDSAGTASDSGGGGGNGAGCNPNYSAGAGSGGSGGGGGGTGDSADNTGATVLAESSNTSTSTGYLLQYTQELTTPSITSSEQTTFTAGHSGTFTVNASGTPTPALSVSGVLPSGVTFVDHGDGTAAFSGVPAIGTGGTYPVIVAATNSTGSVDQPFTLTVDQAPAITGNFGMGLEPGSEGTSVFTASGFPTPVFSVEGPLPPGVTFTDEGSEAVLGGNPAAGTGGSYPLTILATNSSGQVTHPFALTVDQAPAITTSDQASFAQGVSGTFTVETSGYPGATLSETGALPAGVAFTPGPNGTASISGTPQKGTAGSYTVTITAANQVQPQATQQFTLNVDRAPKSKSAASKTFTAGTAGTFTVKAAGFPKPALTETGALPKGITFVDNGNGTATLAGTPAAGSVGDHRFTIIATNSLGSARQTFSLTVAP